MLGQERELVVQLQSKLNLMLGASSRIGLGVLAVAYPFALRTVSKIVLHTGFGPARLGQSTYGAPGGCAGGEPWAGGASGACTQDSRTA